MPGLLEYLLGGPGTSLDDPSQIAISQGPSAAGASLQMTNPLWMQQIPGLLAGMLPRVPPTVPTPPGQPGPAGVPSSPGLGAGSPTGPAVAGFGMPGMPGILGSPVGQAIAQPFQALGRGIRSVYNTPPAGPVDANLPANLGTGYENPAVGATLIEKPIESWRRPHEPMSGYEDRELYGPNADPQYGPSGKDPNDPATAAESWWPGGAPAGGATPGREPVKAADIPERRGGGERGGGDLLGRINNFLSRNSDLLIGLGAGFAGAPSFGIGASRAGQMALKADQIGQQNQLRESSIQALMARGMSRQDAEALIAKTPGILPELQDIKGVGMYGEPTTKTVERDPFSGAMRERAVAPAGAVRVRSFADVLALPPGTVFIDPITGDPRTRP